MGLGSSSARIQIISSEGNQNIRKKRKSSAEGSIKDFEKPDSHKNPCKSKEVKHSFVDNTKIQEMS